MAKDLRSWHGESDIDLPGIFEELLFAIGCHFTRHFATLRFVVRQFETFGPKPIGVLTFSGDGHFSLQWMRSGLPKFAGGDRLKGTPEENQAIVQGSLSYFGTYTVDESSNTLVLHIEGSTFPNWNGKDQKRSFTLAGDKLKLSGIGTSGLPFQDQLQRLK